MSLARKVLPLLLCLSTAAAAAELRLSPQLSPAELATLAEVLADVLAFPNLTTAQPSGLAGFEVMVAAGGVTVDEDQGWYAHAFRGGPTLGFLPSSRLVARKGLPRKIDVGLELGQFAGQRFWGGEVRWSLYPGGTLLPALAAVASYDRFDHPVVQLRVGEVKLVVSKGFLVAAPYLGVGWRRQETEARFGEPVARWQGVEGVRGVFYAGAVVHPLPLLRLVAEVRQGFRTSYFLALGVGL